MSRASTLARAIGADGALNVADVAGLAAVASSGSASDLSTGTLPIARVADGAVTAAKLASTAVTDKLGYTPVNKAGDTLTGNLTIQKSSGNTSLAVATSNANGAINAIEGFGIEIATDGANQSGRFRVGSTNVGTWSGSNFYFGKKVLLNAYNTAFCSTATGGITSYQSGSTWIWDIKIDSAFFGADGALIEWYVSNNPNGGGSGSYRNHAQGYIHISTDWHGSGYTPKINADTVVQNSTGASFNAVIYANGGSGTTQGEYESILTTSQAGNTSMFWSSAPIYLRLKQSGGFNTSYPAQKDLVLFAGTIG